MLRVVPAGVTVVALDVGANVGDWTHHLLRAAERPVVVHALEPFPATFAILEQRMRAEIDEGAVHCHHMGISDRTETRVMFGTAGAGTSSLYGEAPSTDGTPVELSSLDEFVDRHGISDVHFVKCDLEGHDLAALAGADRLLASGQIWMLQFEYNHRWVFAHSFLYDAFAIARRHSYGLAKVTPLGPELYEEWHPELERMFEANYVLIRRDLIAPMRCRTMRPDGANTFAAH
jgi:FkbM family methyltransferase